MSPILVGELLVSHSVSVRKITTSDQVTGGDKNLDLVYMNPRVLYSINVFTHVPECSCSRAVDLSPDSQSLPPS